MAEEGDKLRKRLLQLTRKHQQVLSAYRLLHHYARDITPQGVPIPGIDEHELRSILDSQLDGGLHSLAGTGAGQGGDQSNDNEVQMQLLREALQDCRSQLDQQKQMALTQAEGFQRSSATLQKEHIRLQEDYAALQKAHARCTGQNTWGSAEDSKQSIYELQTYLEKKFRDQMDELKHSTAAAAAMVDATAPNRALQQELYSVKDELEVLRSENKRLKEQLSSAKQQQQHQASDEDLSSYKAEYLRKEQALKARIQELQEALLTAKVQTLCILVSLSATIFGNMLPSVYRARREHPVSRTQVNKCASN